MFVIKLPKESIEIIWPRTFSSTTSGSRQVELRQVPDRRSEPPRIEPMLSLAATGAMMSRP